MNRQERRASAKQSTNPGAPRKDTPAAWFEAGHRLLKAGQLAEAEQCGRSALALDVGHADSLHLMGILCVLSKRHDLAIGWFAHAIRQNSNVSDYFFNLASALEQQGRLDEAIRILDRGLVLSPDSVGGWCRLGTLLHRQKRFDEALLSFEEARRREPDHLEATNASALLCFETGRYDAAIERFDRSIKIKPGDAGAWHFKAICLLRSKRVAEALPICEQAFALAPAHAEIATNLGSILQKLDRNEEALVLFDRVLAREGNLPNTLNHRGMSLQVLHRFGEAIASFDKAIAIDPDYAEAHWNAALLRLLLGDFAGAWEGREWGRKCAAVGFIERPFPQPVWRGDVPLAGKTILLHSDEGLGDSIQFSRYATLAARRGARVILEVQDVLQPLLSGIEGVAECLPKTKDTLPDFDLHCPLSSLPLAFRTRLETIPTTPSYLPPPPARVAHWQARLGARDRLRVGLVWSGNPVHGNDRNRSMSFQTLLPLLDAGARFISLQKDPRSGDAKELRIRPDVVDLTADLADFVETAALVCCLDLVITVDTSVAHLSAALGRPTWILLPHTPDYRWLLDRDDSPWYPSARLFRQDTRRDYASVIARVRDALDARIAAAG